MLSEDMYIHLLSRGKFYHPLAFTPEQLDTLYGEHGHISKGSLTTFYAQINRQLVNQFLALDLINAENTSAVILPFCCVEDVFKLPNSTIQTMRQNIATSLWNNKKIPSFIDLDTIPLNYITHYLDVLPNIGFFGASLTVNIETADENDFVNTIDPAFEYAKQCEDVGLKPLIYFTFSTDELKTSDNEILLATTIIEKLWEYDINELIIKVDVPENPTEFDLLENNESIFRIIYEVRTNDIQTDANLLSERKSNASTFHLFDQVNINDESSVFAQKIKDNFALLRNR